MFILCSLVFFSAKYSQKSLFSANCLFFETKQKIEKISKTAVNPLTKKNPYGAIRPWG